MNRPNSFLLSLRAELHQLADPSHRIGQQSFFKEPVNPLGVRCRELNAVEVGRWRELKRLTPEELLELCEALWCSEIFEEPVLAAKWCARAAARLGPEALTRYSCWLETRVHNWAHCDALCAMAIGKLVLVRPELAPLLLTWTKSTNRWMRRGAAVILVPAARKGLLWPQVFATAEALLADTDDLVRKGVGWLLRESSKRAPGEVHAYVMTRRDSMARATLRCAIELLTPEQRRQAMQRD